jgi:hypothetical protein
MNDSNGIFDAITGENKIIKLTNAEQVIRDAEGVAYLEIRAARELAAESAVAAKAALLARLGITADEAKLLLG